MTKVTMIGKTSKAEVSVCRIVSETNVYDNLTGLLKLFDKAVKFDIR